MYDAKKEIEKLEEVGIKISVILDPEGIAKTLEPAADGLILISPVKLSRKFRIVLKIEPGEDKITPAIIQGKQRTISFLSNKAPEKEAAIYFRNVSTHQVPAGYSTQYVDNNLRIFRISGNLFQMWEIAIVTRIICTDQNQPPALYFLTIQLVYESEMFEDPFLDSIVVMPNYDGYEKWDSLKEYLPDWVDLDDIPSLAEYRPRVTAKTKKMLENNEARVLFFNLANGKGKIETGDGRVLTAHWSQIKTVESPEEFAYLETGQVVTFEGVDAETMVKGDRGKYVMINQATGIAPVAKK